MILPIRFCSQCGATTSLDIPAGDTHARFVCDACKHIHYQNPKIVVGTIPEWEDRILFCRRAIEPGYGRWTLPGGFLENGETIEQGAIRETMEECQAEVDLTSLYSVYSIPHISQVYMMFRAKMREPTFAEGEESLEVRLFRYDEIPWDKLAFRVVCATMKHHVADAAQNDFSVHIGTILPTSDGPHPSHKR